MKLIKLLLASIFMFAASVVYAEPADVLRGADGFVCLDANGDPAVFPDRFQRVETNSDTGQISYRVHGECLGVLPAKGAVHWSDQNTEFICIGDAPYFKMVVTRSGKASMKCQNWPFED